MRNLPESAGSPISQMPQKTKGGLLSTHQPYSTVYHNFPEPKSNLSFFSEGKLELPYRNNKPRPVITVPSPEQHIIPNKTSILNIHKELKKKKESVL
jgi:hypothetical protein